jgi:hypothetical protein
MSCGSVISFGSSTHADACGTCSISLEPDLTDLQLHYTRKPLSQKVYHAEYIDRADNLFAASQLYTLLPYLPYHLFPHTRSNY